MTLDTSRRQLVEDGYCVIRDVLDQDLLGSLRALARDGIADASVEHRALNRSQGSLVLMAEYPAFADLIAYPPTMAIFDGLGFRDPRFSSGYIISKPPGGPPLFWHQDWWAWDDPVSYTDEVCQVFLFYYLTDTTVENGCLRVVPGSHRRCHSLHDAPAAHDEALARVTDPSAPIYQSVADEVAVPVKAGDLIIGDARLLHGAYANDSNEERTLLTLWYHPNFAGLPAPMQARIYSLFKREGNDTDPAAAGKLTPDVWPAAERQRIAHLFPSYLGPATPQPWNRSPDWSRA